MGPVPGLTPLLEDPGGDKHRTIEAVPADTILKYKDILERTGWEAFTFYFWTVLG